MSTYTLKEFLFKGFEGCKSHNCIVEKPKGMGTNGSCSCIVNANRTKLNILQSRIKALSYLDTQINKEENK